MFKTATRFLSRLVAYPVLGLVVGSYLAVKLGFLEIDDDSSSNEAEIAKLSSLQKFLKEKMEQEAIACHELAAAFGKFSSADCSIGFDYRKHVMDESMKEVADKFRLILEQLQSSINKLNATTCSPINNVNFIEKRLEKFGFTGRESKEASLGHSSGFTQISSSHKALSSRYSKVLNEKLEEIMAKPVVLLPHDEPLLSDANLIEGHKEALSEILNN